MNAHEAWKLKAEQLADDYAQAAYECDASAPSKRAALLAHLDGYPLGGAAGWRARHKEPGAEWGHTGDRELAAERARLPEFFDVEPLYRDPRAVEVNKYAHVHLCASCFPAHGEHEALTIVSLSGCNVCGNPDAYVFRRDPRTVEVEG